MSLYDTFIRFLYSWEIPVSELITEYADWGLTGFSMGSSITETIKLEGAFFLCFFVLYLWGGGGCVEGPLSTLISVTGYCGIVCKTVGASTLGGIQAGSSCGDILDTLRSNGIVNFGIGDVLLERTGAAV